jgi:hypothetical protein
MQHQLYKMDPTGKIEEIIKEIAHKNGIAIGRDDPIMILHTINERLLRDTQRSQQAALDSFKSELELISHRWGQDAKDKAERILNAALQASKESMATSINEGTRQAVESAKKELAKASAPAVKAAQDVQKAAWIALSGGGLAFMAAVVAWLAGRH